MWSSEGDLVKRGRESGETPRVKSVCLIDGKHVIRVVGSMM